MAYLFLTLVFTPIIELWLILKVGSAIGAGSTVALILLTAVIGTTLLRKQGFSTLFRARQKMDHGQIPAKEMAEGLMLAFAGALMLTPGFVTDAIGFALLIPQVRQMIIDNFSGSAMFSTFGAQTEGQRSNFDDSSVIIEGEFTSESRTNNEKLL